MAIVFTEPFLHGRNRFPPTVALAFDDDRAEEYFVAAGAAETTVDEPVMTYPEGTINHVNAQGETLSGPDPDTVFAHGPNKGQKVLPPVEEE